MPSSELKKKRVLDGREAVDAYRTAHIKLYNKSWHKGIPEEHIPLLEVMLRKLSIQGFNSIQEFFGASTLLNVKELGFASWEDFVVEADRLEAEGLVEKLQNFLDRLNRMWH